MFSQLPKHVAFIMDGNGRWARRRGLPRIRGHAEGVRAAERVIDLSKEFGIPFITLYAFSTENWKRPREEVQFLMELLREYLKSNLSRFLKDGIRLRFIGRRDRIPKETLEWMERVEKETSHLKGITVFVAVDYGGRDEIIRAVRKLLRAGKVEVNEEEFRKFMDIPPDVPDPDLLIRTGGEKRISNFLLWHIAYTELYFTETLWPDFDRDEYLKALEDFSKRKRKFGGLPADEGMDSQAIP